MGKKSDEKKGKKSRIMEQEESRSPPGISDAKGEEDVADLSRKERKKKKRKHESGCAADEFASAGNTSENVKGGDVDAANERKLKKKRKLELDNDQDMELEKTLKKDKKKRHRETKAGDGSSPVPLTGNDNDKYKKENSVGDERSKSEGAKSKKKKKKEKHNLGDDELVGVEERQGIVKNNKNKKEDGTQGEKEDTSDQLDSANGVKIKKKKKKKLKDEKEKKKREKEEEKKKQKSKPAKESSRKVRFADDVEIFPSLDGPSEANPREKDDLVRGKRFSLEEDELIRESVYKYIEDHSLGEDGVTMILQCKSHPEIRNCWKDIGAALPWRHYTSVYYRAHILFERSETRSWTEEERELIKRFHEEHGSDWRTLADAMGKHRIHVKDTWRRIKLPNLKRGFWTQEEYQALFDLVNKDLQMKAVEEKVSNYRNIRDNISWEAISQTLSTRTDSSCCMKWYDQLTSPMVAEGAWADADDYRLLNALVGLDACSMEEVDWDRLIEGRPGDVCRKRWAQMVKHIGEHRTKSFVEQVEILSERYCPDLVEVREACDRKREED